MWNGHRELRGAACRATPPGAEVALPIGSYTSAPNDTFHTSDVGTDTPGHPSAIGTDSHSLSCSRVIGSLASHGKHLTCGTQLTLRKQLTSCRVHLAPLPVSSSRSASACSYLADKWQFDVAYTPSATFTRWYMTRLTCRPLLLKACH